MSMSVFRALWLGLLVLAAPSLWAASLQAELVDSAGQPLGNAVISLHGPLGEAPEAAPGLMDQRAQQFVPHVLAVRTGTAVSFPNSDDIRHHVYSFSPAKRFELRLYKDTPSAPVLFDTPGVVVLGCNIHDWMLGYVYVTDDPWFAVSDEQGRVQLDALPPGRYRVSLWHPKLADMLSQPGGELQLGEGLSTQRYSLAVQAAVAAPGSAPKSSFGDAFKQARDAAQ